MIFRYFDLLLLLLFKSTVSLVVFDYARICGFITSVVENKTKKKNKKLKSFVQKKQQTKTAEPRRTIE